MKKEKKMNLVKYKNKQTNFETAVPQQALGFQSNYRFWYLVVSMVLKWRNQKQ